MENVLGLRNAAGGIYLPPSKRKRALGALGTPRLPRAWPDGRRLGAWRSAKRRRQLIIGVRNDLPGYFLPELNPPPRAEPRPWLWDAIGDLPILRAGGGDYERDYDFARRVKHVEQHGGPPRCGISARSLKLTTPRHSLATSPARIPSGTCATSQDSRKAKAPPSPCGNGASSSSSLTRSPASKTATPGKAAGTRAAPSSPT